MGAGKAFGSLCEKYELGDYAEFNRLLLENNAIVSGSEMINLYHKLNSLSTFDSNDLDIFVKKNVKYIDIEDDKDIKDETKDEKATIKEEEKDNIKTIDKFLTSKGYKGKKMEKPEKYSNKNIIEVIDYIKEKSKIQIIVIKTDPIDYVKTFDLTCCMYLWNPKTEYIEYFGNQEDKGKMITRLLLGENIKHNSIDRAYKYTMRGFKIYYQDRDITELIKFIHLRNFSIIALKLFLEQTPEEAEKFRDNQRILIEKQKEKSNVKSVIYLAPSKKRTVTPKNSIVHPRAIRDRINALSKLSFSDDSDDEQPVSLSSIISKTI
jgi:hypothetical protein